MLTRASRCVNPQLSYHQSLIAPGDPRLSRLKTPLREGNGRRRSHQSPSWTPPFVLPPNISLDEYRAYPVCYLSYFNYKLESFVGPSKKTQQRYLTVLDTCADPNLILVSLLPDDVLSHPNKSREVVNLSSFSKHRLDVLGLVPLTITVANVNFRQIFVSVRQLGADIILGCQFITMQSSMWLYRNRSSS